MRIHPNINDHGSVFLTTMIAIFLMTLVGAYTYQMSTQDIHFVRQLEKSTQAQQLAEAGLARALSKITSTSSDTFESVVNNDSNFPLTSLAPGTYDASVTQISSGDSGGDDDDHEDDDHEDDDHEDDDHD